MKEKTHPKQTENKQHEKKQKRKKLSEALRKNLARRKGNQPDEGAN